MLWMGHTKLKSEDPKERREAAEKMGLPGNAKAVQPLMLALEDEDRYVREAAAVSLGRIGDFHATPALAAAVMRKDYAMVQAKAIIALGKIGDSGGISALMAALNRQVEHLPVQEGEPEDRILTGILQVPQLDIKQEEAQSVFLQLSAVVALTQTQNSKAARMLTESLARIDSDLLRYQISGCLKRYGMPAEIRKLEAEFGFKLDEVINKAEAHLGDVGAYAVRAIESMLVEQN